LTRTQAANPSSPIIQVDRRCGRGRHYVPAHVVKAYRDRAGHFHPSRRVAGYCARDRR
jgi:hypothetical protein